MIALRVIILMNIHCVFPDNGFRATVTDSTVTMSVVQISVVISRDEVNAFCTTGLVCGGPPITSGIATQRANIVMINFSTTVEWSLR